MPIFMRVLLAAPLVVVAQCQSGPVFADVTVRGGFAKCWGRPEPKSLVELAIVAKNQARRGRRTALVRRNRQPAALALSDGALRVAFAAGLLVGWSETGRRPIFNVVTAVGPSSLLAPFAFVGVAGDQSIADLFVCPSKSWRSMADRAAGMITDRMLTLVAEKHQAGRRLLIAVKGNAARPSGVWDIGWIAAHRGNEVARTIIKSIFRASVALNGFPESNQIPEKAAGLLHRNRSFRHVGSGRAFLPPPKLSKKLRSIYFVHNDVLLASDHFEFRQKMQVSELVPSQDHFTLRTGYDLVEGAKRNGMVFRFASMKRRKWFYPRSEFDPVYARTLFQRTYRSARMGRIWRSRFPQK